MTSGREAESVVPGVEVQGEARGRRWAQLVAEHPAAGPSAVPVTLEPAGHNPICLTAPTPSYSSIHNKHG